LYTVKVLIFASFEEDVRQRKIVTKDYLCQSLIVVTSTINWYSDELSKGMKLGKAASDVKIDIKLSTIKPGRQSDTQ
jgi:hypothetical protein